MKYEFTGLTKTVLGVVLKQIIRKADKVIGGWIESEKNLSQVYGDAWVGGDAQVYGNALVYGNAQVYGNARVHGNALVYGNALVSGNARVYRNAQVYGDAWVYGDALVYGGALVSGDAQVYGDAQVLKNSDIINVILTPYSITITPQNINIGCTLKSRFGKGQWTSKGQDKDLVKIYAPLLKVLKKQLPRQRAKRK